MEHMDIDKLQDSLAALLEVAKVAHEDVTSDMHFFIAAKMQLLSVLLAQLQQQARIADVLERLETKRIQLHLKAEKEGED